MRDWIARLFEDPELLRMGHAQRRADLNLGLGWVYYGLARALRPARVVVIGSWRGFVPLVFGRALADNAEGGEVWFIDPSLADGFWLDPDAVRAHFASFGVTNVRHFRMTTQEFAASEAHASLGEVGIVFVDGYHSVDQVRFDWETFADRIAPGGLGLFHDSLRVVETRVYGAERAYECRVKDFIDELRKDPRLELLELPWGDGVTLVRRLER
jgi:predicted O-methyltransferase YrrM